ncbi:hypothetical protein CspeluHIS016_0206450 [Cutaneotrichosporon spelunceum]|uniref:Integrase catalytic domain-containing protein n=1 Tax=Cutaneotrichosporon spelunceum TaxID=1672016 RepID=A0AAD3TRS4_9TREE|nr:hypothetical protein CspeluHIS016_0206450 [Cutaneotrichosporon spelunceum]
MSDDSVSGALKVVPRLTGMKNFNAWNRAIRAYLLDKGALGHLEGSVNEPFRRIPNVDDNMAVLEAIRPHGQYAGVAPPMGLAISANIAEDPHLVLDAAQLATWELWERKERRARAALLITVSDKIHDDIEHQWSSSNMYDSIVYRYRSNTSERRAHVHARLMNLNLVAPITFERMQDHHDKFSELATELRRIGYDLSEDYKCELFLLSLPPELEDSITTRFRSNPEDEREWETLTRVYEEKADRLFHHASRGRALLGEDGVAVIFSKDAATKPPPKRKSTHKRPGQPNPDRNITCFWCQKKGHRMEACGARRRGTPQRPAAPQQPSAAAAAASILSVNGGSVSAITALDHEPGQVAELAEVALNADPVTTTTLLIDSGATHNIVGNADLLSDVKELSHPRNFKLAGTRFTMTATQLGSLVIHGPGGSEIIKDVYHCPDTTDNILATPQLRSQGWLLDLANKQLVRNGVTFPLTETPTGRPCLLQEAQLAAQEDDQPASPFDSPLFRIHKRLGHLGRTSLLDIIRSNILPDIGMTHEEASTDPFTIEHCDNCLAARSTRFPRLGKPLRGSAKGEVVHFDLKGPLAPSRLGSVYWLGVATDYTRYRCVIALEDKKADKVLAEIKDQIRFIETQSGIPVKVVRTDRGTEFVNDASNQWYKWKGIIHHTSAPYIHEHNGVAERLNRTVGELVRALLDGSAFDHAWWDWAARHACNVLNSTTLCEDGRTAWEIMFHRKPTFATMWQFGEICYAVRYATQSKASLSTMRAFKARVLMRDTHSSTWQVRRESTGVIMTVSDIRRAAGHSIMEPLPKVPGPEAEIPVLDEAAEEHATGEQVAAFLPTFCANLPTMDELLTYDGHYPGLLASAAAEAAEADPLTIQEAAATSEWPQWYAAILAEVNNLETKGTWSEAVLPPGRKTISSKWVLKRKRDATGNIVKYKARLVARGFSQVPGVEIVDFG